MQLREYFRRYFHEPYLEPSITTEARAYEELQRLVNAEEAGKV